MILKLIYILCLFFSVYENFYASTADSISLSIKKFLPLKNVTASDALIARQKDNASSKSVKNIFNASSNILNVSSNISELTPQAYPGNKSVDIEQERKITFHREHPALVNATSTIHKNTDFLLFDNETLVGKYRQMKSIKFDAVNQTRDTDNAASSNDMMKTASARAYTLHRMARANTESVQTVLKKIFPDHFFPKESDSDFNGSRDVNNKNNNSPRRRQKIKKLDTERFGGESVYFRANDQTATGGTPSPTTDTAQTTEATISGVDTASTSAVDTTTTSGATTIAPTTNGTGTPVPGVPEADNTPSTASSEGGETSTIPGENQTEVSSGQQVNYHYHFHYFGVLAAPTLPGGKTT